jgi:hypothetical protein
LRQPKRPPDIARPHGPACAADPWDGALHNQLVRLLTNLAEFTPTEEALAPVNAAQKIVDRFVALDPENTIWRRESLRVDYHRVAARLKAPTMSLSSRRGERLQLQMEQARVLREMLRAIEKLNEHDPENYLWLRDRANLEDRVAKLCLTLAQEEAKLKNVVLVRAALSAMIGFGFPMEPPSGPAYLAEARKLAQSSFDRYEKILVRDPKDADLRSDATASLYTISQLERESGNAAAALIARWAYDARYISYLQSQAAAFPTIQRWQLRLRDGYARMIFQFGGVMEKLDWNILGQPEVANAFRKLAAAVADFPDGTSEEVKKYTLPHRQLVGKVLREYDARRLLPPEGKRLIERIPVEP